MDVQDFLIQIGTRSYKADIPQQQFIATTDASEVIPFHQFRYQQEHWFILWDRKLNTYYNPSLHTVHSNVIPLSVEWVKIEIIDINHPLIEQVGTLILLSEVSEQVKRTSFTARPKKINAGLRKAVLTYIEQQGE